ncbi:biotin operon repressor / biotin-protein ligase [hydrocarbon metagenome]|uniref:Biotin operon repressor / biotin-protein ligase n=1 Tax=hydrocarbon metagenome TaxID=938273 RepID=A0A0W8FSX1_9ZZZZ
MVDWNLDILKKSLAGKYFGHRLYYYPVTGSTNDDAFKLGIAGAPEGTVVVADAQTKGRGRLQRSWHSPAGSNIYTTVILRPQMDAAITPQISILAGVAVAEVLASYCPGRVKVKWPNDILIDGKKVCGILSQAKADVNKVDFVILGIGINVNINQFPDEISNIATSLAMETGKQISRQQLIISLYENMTKWYKQLLKDGFSQIKEKWLGLSQMIGQKVQVIFQEEVISGDAVDIDNDGSLIIIAKDGKKIKASAGDATIIG